MARNFASASSQYMENTSLPVSATPLSMALWCRPATANTRYDMLSINASGNNTNFWSLQTDNTGKIIASTNSVTAQTSTSFTANVWCHACAVFNSATDRRAFLNGGSKGTNTTSRTPTSPARFAIGCLDGSSRQNFMNGDIAEVGMWNIALSDTEVAMLATGVSPLMVRPDALVFYAPLLGRDSPEPDFKGKFNMTLAAAAPTQAAHPRIYYPSGPIYSSYTAVSANLVAGPMQVLGLGFTANYGGQGFIDPTLQKLH